MESKPEDERKDKPRGKASGKNEKRAWIMDERGPSRMPQQQK